LTRIRTQFIREGQFVADVEIALNESDSDWGPTVSLPDIQKLDRVRSALRAGDIACAGREAKVFRLVPEPQDVGRQAFSGFKEGEQETFE
jgi:hypothetical protein